MVFNFKCLNEKGEDKDGMLRLTWLRDYKSKLMRKVFPKKVKEDCLIINISNLKRKRLKIRKSVPF